MTKPENEGPLKEFRKQKQSINSDESYDLEQDLQSIENSLLQSDAEIMIESDLQSIENILCISDPETTTELDIRSIENNQLKSDSKTMVVPPSRTSDPSAGGAENLKSEFDWEDEDAVVSNLTLLAVVGVEDPVRPEVCKVYSTHLLTPFYFTIKVIRQIPQQ